MNDDPSAKRPRRPRYRGTHPRRFEEKYKEREPERYGEEIAKVMAAGRTPAGMHRPIMVAEIMQALSPQPGETALDCTLGYGGHAKELLTAVQPGGHLIGLDVDPVELPKTEKRLRSLGDWGASLIVARANFASLARVVRELCPAGVDALLADLGVSSMQLDDAVRGFSFKVDGPLDMRMNPQRGRSAAEWLDELSEEELARLLKDNADEPLASTLARAILAAHAATPLTTTKGLADVVQTTIQSQTHRTTESPELSVRRVFQALRIAVNDEFRSLDTLLRDLPQCLKPGGRVAILSFHSGEDRRVKRAFKTGLQDGTFASISPEVIRATPEEQRSNPRSSSAKLRWAIRAAAPRQ